ncbi:putative gustatory receptor 2a [Eurosta solidaginis]|uniref:putative gustatory receptor 2a n=1 Tax=Eurosta solidaginis TaxID=178769 RepID=UPI00353161DA
MDIVGVLTFLHSFLQFSALSVNVQNRKNGKLYTSRLLECYSICSWLLSVSFLLYSIFGKNEFPTGNTRLDDTVDFIQFSGIRIVHLVIVTEAFINRHHFAEVVERVREIDRMYVRWLNVDVDNGHLHRCILRWGTIMAALYITIESFIIIAQIFSKESFLSVYFILYLVPFFIVGLRYFQIACFLSVIRQRLVKLVLTLHELDLLHGIQKLNHDLSTDFVSSEYPQYRGTCLENADLHRLNIIRDLYNRLWELLLLLNENYGYSICANVINDFISITANFYWVFLNFYSNSSTREEILQTTSGVLLCVPHIFNLVTFTLLCDDLSLKTTELALGLHRIEWNVDNDNHNTAGRHLSMV